ncbi:MAG: SET domain-containing protein-lysine N-methyltransferase [Saprospiraceae bacterium]
MKVCILQPDYGSSSIDYKNYDPKRNLTDLLPEDEVHHVFLNKLTTYSQIKELSNQNFDIFVNLCEGYLEWDIPSIDVINSLELLNLPYTGPSSKLYDPPKDLMKYVSYCEGIKTPLYYKVSDKYQIADIESILNYPMFVKPLKAGDSLGIDLNSRCTNSNELEEKLNQLLKDYDDVLVEECIDGREFTVLVASNPQLEKECVSFSPVEYIFPKGYSYKTYSLKTSELHPESNRICNDLELELGLRDAAERIFKAFNGIGYARLDFRINDQREIYFLEINFTCSVFYNKGYEGSADYVLEFDGIGQAGFLKLIIAEGIARHKSKQKVYEMKGNAISGFGIYSKTDIRKGQIIFRGEEKGHRLVTKRHVRKNWNQEDKRYFAQYAYPISEQVYALWDDDPMEWAPQNHSCSPNTHYDGLNVLASRTIRKGEELTLDYSSFLDDQAERFQCKCGSPECKKIIKGNKLNSVTEREINQAKPRVKKSYVTSISEK